MLNFDPDREPTTPRDAASVVLLRPRAGSGEAEVFLLRRHRKAKFMATSYVFPGGIVDPGEDDLRVTGARELFEEAGVLLVRPQVDEETRARWRSAMGEETPLAQLLDGARTALDVEALLPLAHWVTPSAEKRRYSARFFLAELPEGQTPSFDNVETVDELWATPAEALARAGELRLPPPQVRIVADLAGAATQGPAAVVALVREQHAPHVHPIVPRFALVPDTPLGFALLLPWDPEYDSLGQGEAVPMPGGHPLATGPSRFVLDEGTWRNV